ncbi:MAG: hypothetical protein QOE70_6633 [Chthoniobacter sp.]|nr:hypothetical protein [Chthoniobacter sp.]
MRRRSIITVGKVRAEIKVYTLRRPNGVASYPCAWYDLGKRQTKTFAEIENAKFFAQQQTLSLRNEGKAVGEASLRDVETLWACECRSQRFGLTLVAAFDEWFAAKSALNGGSVTEAVRFYSAHHVGLPNKPFGVVSEEFYSAKAAAGASFVYCRSLRHYLARMKKPLGATPLADITMPQIDAYLRSEAGNHTTRNNLRRILVTVFRWAQKQGYLAQDRKTTSERAMTFSGRTQHPRFSRRMNAEDHQGLPEEHAAAHRHWRVLRDPLCPDRATRLARHPLGSRLHRDQSCQGEDQGPTPCPSLDEPSRLVGAATERRRPGLPKSEHGNSAELHWRKGGFRLAAERATPQFRELSSGWGTGRRAKVALEMGNSRKMLFKHYRELVTLDAASAWFAISP